MQGPFPLNEKLQSGLAPKKKGTLAALQLPQHHSNYIQQLKQFCIS